MLVYMEAVDTIEFLTIHLMQAQKILFILIMLKLFNPLLTEFMHGEEKSNPIMKYVSKQIPYMMEVVLLCSHPYTQHYTLKRLSLF